MLKQDFLYKLETKLSGLSRQEIKERLNFYNEIIDDKMEEGLTEEQAVEQIGSIDTIASQIKSEFSITVSERHRGKSKTKLKAWERILLVIGSPVWGSLLISAFAVLISLYASLWAVLVSLWASFAALVASGAGGIAAGVIFSLFENSYAGIAIVGAGIVCAGLSIFMFFGCKAVTCGSLILTRKIALLIKICFVGKGDK